MIISKWWSPVRWRNKKKNPVSLIWKKIIFKKIKWSKKLIVDTRMNEFFFYLLPTLTVCRPKTSQRQWTAARYWRRTVGRLPGGRRDCRCSGETIHRPARRTGSRTRIGHQPGTVERRRHGHPPPLPTSDTTRTGTLRKRRVFF